MNEKIPEGANWVVMYTDGDDVHIFGSFGKNEPEVVATAFAESIFEKFRAENTFN